MESRKSSKTYKDNFTLIELVRTRPFLWQKNSPIDLTSREELWDEVSEHMGWSKDVCRHRWKNLRDAYRKVLRKGDSDQSRQIMCGNYKAISFIKETLLSAPPKVLDITIKDKSQQALELACSVAAANDNEEEYTETFDPLAITFKEELVDKETQKHSNKEDVTFGDSSDSSGGNKTIKRRRTSADEDEDHQFLMSLLPHIRQVPANRKLPMRIRIEQIIYEETHAT